MEFVLIIVRDPFSRISWYLMLKKVELGEGYFGGLWMYFCGKSLGFAQISLLRTILSVKLCELLITPGVLVNFN